MSNLTIATTAMIDAATVTASHAVAAGPVTNLQRNQPTDIWRSDSLVPYITVDFGSVKSFNQIALLFTNAQATDVWRIRTADTEAGLLSAPDYDSGSEVWSGTVRNWAGIANLGSNFYLPVNGGDIYKTNDAGKLEGLGQTSRQWTGICAVGSDVYAAVQLGDIYKQTGGTGNFVGLSQTSRAWRDMTVLGSDVYAAVQGGDIYKQTGATGNFVGLGETSREWRGIVATGTDIYACVLNGDIYKQTGGTGSFAALGQTSRQWYHMAVNGSDVYAVTASGDIYKQTGGTGNFVALNQTSRAWNGITSANGHVYACVTAGAIYKQTGGSGDFELINNYFSDWATASDRRHGLWWYPAGLTNRWVRIDIDSTGNADGVFDAGRLVIASAYQPTRNAAYGIAYGFIDASQRDRTPFGNTITNRQGIIPTLSFDIHLDSEAEFYANTFQLQQERGGSRPVFILAEPDHATLAHDKMYYGLLNPTQRTTNDRYNIFSQRFELEGNI